MKHYFEGELRRIYINPERSFLSRAHITICQNAPRPLIQIWALDEKLFTGFIYSSQYTIKVIFQNSGNFCNYRIFELLLFKKIFSSN